MRFEHVRLSGCGHALPQRTVSSDRLEERLAPVYEKLRLRVGRLELMSGIRERRFWEPGTKPSDAAVLAAEDALKKSGIARERIGCLIHASVCRDFLEPATATVVHERLGLAPNCHVFDLSNACLGVANSMVVVGDMIERGSIEAGLIVAGEDGGPLVEETIRDLLERTEPTRDEVKAAFASLTIGAGAAAVVLERQAKDGEGSRLLGGAVRTATQHNALCRGDRTDGKAGPLMSTDSEALLLAGNELAAETFQEFLAELEWSHTDIDRVVTHQVGSAHRRMLFERLELDPALDFPTLETLGNIGSVSLPLSLSMAAEAGFLQKDERIAMLGIGSGLNCMMLGVAW